MDEYIKFINNNKEFIGDSTIIYTGDDSDDFFENIVSSLTDTVIYSVRRKEIPYQFLNSKSLCFFFENSPTSYGIINLDDYVSTFVNKLASVKRLEINIDNYKVLAYPDLTEFKTFTNFSSPDKTMAETGMEKEISSELSILYQPEKFFFNLNKVF